MKIKGYTLHGDYYLADKVVTNVTWEEACKMKEGIILPNGKKVVAHTLSKEELKVLPLKERNGSKWYWTSTPYGCNGAHAWGISNVGGFGSASITYSSDSGGARLGFHKSEIKQFLDIE
jgi:hypothetical protein